MKFKIVLLTLLTITAPNLTQAISMGSISDSLSSNSTPTTQSTKNNNHSSQTAQKTENHFPNPALFIEDSAMTAYIHSQLLLKKNIPSVNVTTENAVVSLSGTVDTEEQANTLVKIASSVRGVRSVNTDRLVVREK